MQPNTQSGLWKGLSPPQTISTSVLSTVAAVVMKTFLDPFPLLLGSHSLDYTLLVPANAAAAGSVLSLKYKQPSAGDC